MEGIEGKEMMIICSFLLILGAILIKFFTLCTFFIKIISLFVTMYL